MSFKPLQPQEGLIRLSSFRERDEETFDRTVNKLMQAPTCSCGRLKVAVLDPEGVGLKHLCEVCDEDPTSLPQDR